MLISPVLNEYFREETNQLNFDSQDHWVSQWINFVFMIDWKYIYTWKIWILLPKLFDVFDFDWKIYSLEIEILFVLF